MGLRAFIRRSIEGIRVESERLRDIDPSRIHFLDVVGVLIRIWPYLKPMFGHSLTYIALAIFATGIGVFFAAVNFGLMYNNIILNEPMAPLAASLLFLDPAEWVEVESLTKAQQYQVIFGVLILATVSTSLGELIGHAIHYYRVWILQGINQNLRLHLMGQFQSLSLKFHADSRTGDSIYRVFQDSAMVTQILQVIMDTFMAGVRFFMGLAVVTAFSPMLGLVLLCSWFPLLWLGRRMSAPLRAGFKVARERNAALTSTIQESIEGIRTIKVNGLEGERQRMFDVDSVGAFAAAHDARVRLMLFGFFVFLFGVAPLAFIELRAALFAYDGAETFLRDFLLAFGFGLWNLGGQDQARSNAKQSMAATDGLVKLWGRLQDVAIGLGRVYQILDLTPDVHNLPGARALPPVQHSIRFDEVRFSYPGREVFTDVTFEAKVGEVTAILGPTGTGKTTLMLLLLRMLEFHGGRIALDGEDIRGFTFESVRNNIALATQENILFSKSLLENIRYARPDASDEEVRAAARVACVDEYVDRLADGYDTFLGERASKLSTGQRQRLVIARAVLKDTPILILDEPTASLDAVHELRIMNRIKEWAEQRTVFLITHRLSTVRQADRIVFLGDGVVADTGSHDELMARPTAYRDFVNAELEAVGTAAGG